MSQKKTGKEEDNDLLMLLSQGDSFAFAKLFNEHKDKLYSFVISITRSEEMAEDIVQDVFLKIWDNRHIATEVENFNALVYRMAKHKAIDLLRRTSRQALFSAEMLYLNSSTDFDNPLEKLKVAEIREQIDAVVANLPHQQRTVYRLYKEEGFKADEIAKQLNLSVSTIRNHLMHALNTIRRSIFGTCWVALCCIFYNF